ncbi:MAG: hypothetical protein Q8912_14660 [Bacillota bacterium]|nr:hypothetical protein [Bacillota bacterium]
MGLISWYGLYEIINQYVGSSSESPLLSLCRYEHGWDPTPVPDPFDYQCNPPLMLVWSKRRLEQWNKASNIPSAIMGAPFVHYRKLRQIEKDTTARGTVAFPAHSTRLIDAVFDIDNYCNQLKSLPSEYHPITICLHIHDLERKKDLKYKEHGFNVVSAGEGNVLRFEYVDKFYDILKSHKCATSNQVGSYSFYAVEMGIPFFIFGEEANLVNSGDPLWPSEFSYDDYPIGVYATNLFKGPTQVIREEQKKFVEDELGIHDCLSGTELRELLIESNRRTIEAYEESLDTGQGGVEDKIATCATLVDYFQHLGEKDKFLKYVFKSFEYAPPKANFCCYLGSYFKDVQQYEQAVFWYDLATRLEKPIGSWLTWFPHLQLCLCYDRLGKHELAYKHNEIAWRFNPENEAVLHNKKYFERLFGRESSE